MNTLNSFLLHLQLIQYSYILTKPLPHADAPKSHNPVKCVHFFQIVSIVLAIVAYYAGIMLKAFAFLLCSKYAGIANRLKPTLFVYTQAVYSLMIHI